MHFINDNILFNIPDVCPSFSRKCRGRKVASADLEFEGLQLILVMTFVGHLRHLRRH